jgi:hypothetical protein
MRFLALEECGECARCAALTPHSRRRIAPLLVLAALAAGSGGVLAAVAPRAEAFVAAGLLAFAALLLVLLDRRLGWHIACERCRGKLLAVRRWRWRDLSDTVFSG